jgi:hypothetical protein
MFQTECSHSFGIDSTISTRERRLVLFENVESPPSQPSVEARKEDEQTVEQPPEDLITANNEVDHQDPVFAKWRKLAEEDMKNQATSAEAMPSIVNGMKKRLNQWIQKSVARDVGAATTALDEIRTVLLPRVELLARIFRDEVKPRTARTAQDLITMIDTPGADKNDFSNVLYAVQRLSDELHLGNFISRQFTAVSEDADKSLDHNTAKRGVLTETVHDEVNTERVITLELTSSPHVHSCVTNIKQQLQKEETGGMIMKGLSLLRRRPGAYKDIEDLYNKMKTPEKKRVFIAWLNTQILPYEMKDTGGRIDFKRLS